MTRVSLSLFMALLLFGCASSNRRRVQENATVEAHSGPVTLATLLSDEAQVLLDSEFNIVFPLENPPGTRKITARAVKGKVSAETHSSKKKLKSGVLSTDEYKDFIARIRGLDEEAFSEEPGECQEPYNFRVRVGDRQRVFAGCRGLGSNASAISKLVRDLEFRLIQSASN